MTISRASSIYSTITDLSKAGKAILSCRLITPTQTRRWLKPVTHTSDLVNSNGRPWEIYSQVQNDTDPILDVYTKTGVIGHCSSYLGLLPDYDVGFVILAADQSVQPDLNVYADIVGDLIVPGVLETAIGDALLGFGGTYQNGNSSITISVATKGTTHNPGLSVDNLTSNGADVRAAIAKLNVIDPSGLSFRLYPTNLRSTSGSTMRVAFRAVFQDELAFEDSGTPACISWMGVDALTYDSVALDLFFF
ncbi:hypothetical protein MMC14_009114 [Varicellaria rhodocarpa]|nr:hypothetical protein [Varicellaria rhodocarpa]